MLNTTYLVRLFLTVKALFCLVVLKVFKAFFKEEPKLVFFFFFFFPIGKKPLDDLPQH